MKKLIKIICIIVISIMLACWLILSLATLGICQETNQNDTIKTYTKILNYGKPDRAIYKCFVIQNGENIDTIEVLQAQSQRDNDSTMIILKAKIENDYKADLKTLQELQMKIIKEESYLEILNYLIEEKKK